MEGEGAKERVSSSFARTSRRTRGGAPSGGRGQRVRSPRRVGERGLTKETAGRGQGQLETRRRGRESATDHVSERDLRTRGEGDAGDENGTAGKSEHGHDVQRAAKGRKAERSEQVARVERERRTRGKRGPGSRLAKARALAPLPDSGDAERATRSSPIERVGMQGASVRPLEDVNGRRVVRAAAGRSTRRAAQFRLNSASWRAAHECLRARRTAAGRAVRAGREGKGELKERLRPTGRGPWCALV